MARKAPEEKLPEVKVEPTEAAGVVIPLSACPPELRYLGQGKSVGLKVLGRLTPDGIAVDGIVLLR